MRLLWNHTPYEMFTGTKPSVSHMKPFGWPVYFHIPDKLWKKLDSKAKTGIFIGYSDEMKGYRVWDNSKQQVVISRDITFDEAKILRSHCLVSSSSPNPVQKPQSVVPFSLLNIQTPDSQTTRAVPIQLQAQPLLPQLHISGNASIDLNDASSSAEPNVNLRTIVPQRPARQRHQCQRYGKWFYSFSAMAGTLPSMPKPVTEAMSSPNRQQWKEAMDSEYNSLLENNTWTVLPLPSNRKAIKYKWVFALKTKPDGSIERFKARLVAKGCSQTPGVDFKETFSPTVKYDSIQLILAIVAAQDLYMKQFDIKTTFLYGSVKEELYMQQIEGYEDQEHPDWVYLLLKALYGLRQASRAWHDKIATFLTKFDLQQADVDPCVYYSSIEGITTIVCIFVDDSLICSSSKDCMKSILKFMNDVFITKVFEPSVYVGLHIQRNRISRTITIDQAAYIQTKILQQYNLLDVNPMKTPADSNSRLNWASNSCTDVFDKKFPYSNMVGSLQFVAITTQGDISYATSIVAGYKNHPSIVHCNAVKRVAKYLKGTKDYKIRLGGTKTTRVLTAYTDADFAADTDDRKSRTGYVLYYNNGPIAWGSKKQSCVATSITHAEYIALYTATKEVVWCRRLLAALGQVQYSPTVIYTDSQSAMRLALNPKFHARTKHIDIKFHYTRDEIVARSIHCKYVPSLLQVVDLFTKPLHPDQFTKLRSMLLITNDDKRLIEPP
jgi:hypothetical protein